MPGQLCSGNSTAVKNANVKDSKAFCEGMAYRQGGTAAARPVTDNPHAGGSAKDAWADGWEIADVAAGGSITQADMGCCAIPPDVSI